MVSISAEQTAERERWVRRLNQLQLVLRRLRARRPALVAERAAHVADEECTTRVAELSQALHALDDEIAATDDAMQLLGSRIDASKMAEYWSGERAKRAAAATIEGVP